MVLDDPGLNQLDLSVYILLSHEDLLVVLVLLHTMVAKWVVIGPVGARFSLSVIWPTARVLLLSIINLMLMLYLIVGRVIRVLRILWLDRLLAFVLLRTVLGAEVGGSRSSRRVRIGAHGCLLLQPHLRLLCITTGRLLTIWWEPSALIQSIYIANDFCGQTREWCLLVSHVILLGPVAIEVVVTLVCCYPRLREEFEPFTYLSLAVLLTVVIRAMGFSTVLTMLTLLDFKKIRMIFLLLPSVRIWTLILIGTTFGVWAYEVIHLPVRAHLARVCE